MRILFNNLILDDNCTLSSITVSENYPLDNLKSRVLTKRTQSESTTLNFTVNFTVPVTINCFAFGYTNGTSITVKGITQDINYNSDIIYFPAETLSTFDVSITGGLDNIYLGSIGTGLYYQMPNPLNTFGVGIEDTNSLSENKYGIAYKSEGVVLDTPAYTFREVPLAKKKEILALYTGIGSIVWVDPFEGNRDLVEVSYSTISSKYNISYLGRNLFNIECFFKETL